MLKQEYVFLFHLLLIGPGLIILGKYHDHPRIRDNEGLWNLLYLTGLGIIVYHSFMWYQLRSIL